MQIFLNGTESNVSDNLNLESLLQYQSLLEKKGIAVAVNNQVVPKETWGGFTLQNADKILVIKASQGG